MPFVPGIELSRRFYAEVVRPLLDVEHSAALVGTGSEVLGYDTERSTDHDWGPRLQVFVSPSDVDSRGADLAGHLPATFLGYPTIGVTVTDPASWFGRRLGFDPAGGVTTRDWLATPTQLLAEATAGAVYHDGLGALHPVRERLSWYPDDVWRYVLALQWKRVSQEEHLMGRCGEVGDDLGSAVLAARLVRDVMRLCLLLARRYPPYAKWLGTAFARLPEAAEAGRTGRPGATAILGPAVPGARRSPVHRRAARGRHRPGGSGPAAGRRGGPVRGQHRRAEPRGPGADGRTRAAQPAATVMLVSPFVAPATVLLAYTTFG